MGWGDSIPIVEGEIGPPRTGFVHRLCIRKADEAWGRGRAPRRPRGYKILQKMQSLKRSQEGSGDASPPVVTWTVSFQIMRYECKLLIRSIKNDYSDHLGT